MSNLDTMLQRAVTSVPDCVAAGYVDLSSGMILGMKSVDSHPSQVVELLAAACSVQHAVWQKMVSITSKRSSSTVTT
jgi:hypothetical protein